MVDRRSKVMRGAVLLLIGATLAISGCHKIAGGGWFGGLYGGIATFGFQGQCVRQDLGGGEMNWSYEGQFQFSDRSAGVRFHGDIEPFIASSAQNTTCAEDAEASGDPLNEALFVGQCVSQPGGATGSFSVYVIDNGTPDVPDDDYIEVNTPSILSIFNPNAKACTADGLAYSNAGTLGGGNFTSLGH